MEIKELFAKAIEDAAKTHGSKKKLAELIPCKANYLSRWSKPDNYKGTPNEENLKKLIPFLRPYLPEDFDFNSIRDTPPNTRFPMEEKKKGYMSWLEQLSENRSQNIIAGGVINVYGIPIEKIQNAINESSLTQEQKNELTLKIFSN